MTTAYDIWDKQSIPAALQMLPPRTFPRGLNDRLVSGNVGKYELEKLANALRKVIVSEPAPLQDTDDTPTPTEPELPEIPEHEATIIPRDHPLYSEARAALKLLSFRHALMVSEGLSAEPNQDKLAALATDVLDASDAADHIYKKYRKECQKS